MIQIAKAVFIISHALRFFAHYVMIRNLFRNVIYQYQQITEVPKRHFSLSHNNMKSRPNFILHIELCFTKPLYTYFFYTGRGTTSKHDFAKKKKRYIISANSHIQDNFTWDTCLNELLKATWKFQTMEGLNNHMNISQCPYIASFWKAKVHFQIRK